jgi:hypothetical protein
VSSFAARSLSGSNWTARALLPSQLRSTALWACFDIFSNDDAQAAADAKKAGLRAGYDQASGLFGQGRDALNVNYGNAAKPFQALFDQSQKGAGAYGDASGANGADGYARAKTNFQANPGYQFQLDQGLQAIDRGAASRGMVTSGNTLQAEQQFGTGLANQSWKDYMGALQPFLGQGTSAAGGLGAINAGLGNSLNSSYGNQGNLAYQTEVGIGNAQSAAELAKYDASQNLWGGLSSLFNFGSKALPFLPK